MEESGRVLCGSGTNENVVHEVHVGLVVVSLLTALAEHVYTPRSTSGV